MEPVYPFEELAWYPAYRVPSSLTQVSKEGHLLAGSGTSGYFGTSKKRNSFKSVSLQAKVYVKSFAWLPSLERLLKIPSEIH